jgi:hypothetical protein
LEDVNLLADRHLERREDALLKLCIGIIGCLLLVNVAVRAQGEKQFAGKVTKIGDDSFTINRTYVVYVTPETKFTIAEDESAEFSDLRVTDDVAIWARESDSKLVAFSVHFHHEVIEEDPEH